MTIGVVTVAVGKQYLDRLSAWATAVSALETQPDVIAIATNDMPTEYVETVSSILKNCQIVVTDQRWNVHPQVLVNSAISIVQTDWICKLDVDDLIYPHAFNYLAQTEEDVYCFGIKHGNTLAYARGLNAAEVLNADNSLVYSNSPFRRKLWTNNNYIDMMYEDWAFWIGCAAQGASFARSDHIDYEYCQTGHNISNSIDPHRWRPEVLKIRDSYIFSHKDSNTDTEENTK